MPKLSVIIPFCMEWPQVAFTVRSIAEDLLDRVDFEIIAVDNFSPTDMKKTTPDKGSKYMRQMATKHDWLRYEKYDHKLSHWNAKNHAIKNSDSPFLLFIDAHCVPKKDSIYNLFKTYEDNWELMKGSLHLPLVYHILGKDRLQYQLQSATDPKNLHYKFCPLEDSELECIKVPCMSTCGMIIHRKFLNILGLWPTELGIYGGGENFINFAGATCGLNKWLLTTETLYHHGDERGYSWNDKDYLRNRAIAVYMYGGYDMAEEFCLNFRPFKNITYPKQQTYSIFRTVVDTCLRHRKHIKENQVMSIKAWLKEWKETNAT